MVKLNRSTKQYTKCTNFLHSLFRILYAPSSFSIPLHSPLHPFLHGTSYHPPHNTAITNCLDKTSHGIQTQKRRPEKPTGVSTHLCDCTGNIIVPIQAAEIDFSFVINPAVALTATRNRHRTAENTLQVPA